MGINKKKAERVVEVTPPKKQRRKKLVKKKKGKAPWPRSRRRDRITSTGTSRRRAAVNPERSGGECSVVSSRSHPVQCVLTLGSDPFSAPSLQSPCARHEERQVHLGLQDRAQELAQRQVQAHSHQQQRSSSEEERDRVLRHA